VEFERDRITGISNKQVKEKATELSGGGGCMKAPLRTPSDTGSKAWGFGVKQPDNYIEFLY